MHPSFKLCWTATCYLSAPDIISTDVLNVVDFYFPNASNLVADFVLPLPPPSPVWGTENEEVARAIYKVCVR